MTPFADYLFQIRRAKGLRQKDLADRLEVGSSYICGLEAGRKDPPGPEQLERFAHALALTSEQTTDLMRMAELSRRRIDIPSDASKEEFMLAHEFAAHLGSLSTAQVEMIKMFLRIAPEDIPRKPPSLKADGATERRLSM